MIQTKAIESHRMKEILYVYVNQDFKDNRYFISFKHIVKGTTSLLGDMRWVKNGSSSSELSYWRFQSQKPFLLKYPELQFLCETGIVIKYLPCRAMLNN